MTASSAALTDILLKQDTILKELLATVEKQRAALKEGRLAEVQNLMSELRHVSVRSQAIETKRLRAAEELAGQLGTEAIVSAMVPALAEEARAPLEAAASGVIQTVQRLKIEMSILARLMDEAKSLNEMLISEWQKLSSKSMGAGAMGSFDARI